MGNCQCNNDDPAQNEFNSSNMLPAQSEDKKKALLSSTPVITHSPPPSVAQKVDKMNNLTQKSEETYKKIKADPSLKVVAPSSEEPILGPYKYEDGSTYEGEYKNGKRSGYGILVTFLGMPLIYQITAKGKIQEGFWVNDQLQGKATEIYPQGKNEHV